MDEALRASTSPGIHGEQHKELNEVSEARGRNHAQVLEALAALKQQLEDNHALATKQRADQHAEKMKQRSSHHAEKMKMRADHHAAKMNKLADLHAQQIQQHEAAAAQRTELQAQQLQQHEAAAAQRTNLVGTFQKYSERAEQFLSAQEALQGSPSTVAFWVQKESVASNAGVLVSFCASGIPLQYSTHIPGVHSLLRVRGCLIQPRGQKRPWVLQMRHSSRIYGYSGGAPSVHAGAASKQPPKDEIHRSIHPFTVQHRSLFCRRGALDPRPKLCQR